MNMYAANETLEKHNVINYFWVVDHYQFMAITLNNKPTMYEFYWMLKGKLQCILTISHLASLFQNLKHANHLALHFAPLCVLSGWNLLLSYVFSYLLSSYRTRPLPNKRLTKISKPVEASALKSSCWTSQSTQCLGSVVPLSMFFL